MSIRTILLAAMLAAGALTMTACVDAPGPHPRVIGYGTDYHPGGHD